MVWVKAEKTHDRRFSRFSQSGAVLPNAVEEGGVPLNLAKKDFTPGAKQGLLSFHIRDLPRRSVAIERCEPQPKLAVAVGRVENQLPAVRRNVVPHKPGRSKVSRRRDLKSWEQRLG